MGPRVNWNVASGSILFCNAQCDFGQILHVAVFVYDRFDCTW